MSDGSKKGKIGGSVHSPAGQKASGEKKKINKRIEGDSLRSRQTLASLGIRAWLCETRNNCAGGYGSNCTW